MIACFVVCKCGKPKKKEKENGNLDTVGSIKKKEKRGDYKERWIFAYVCWTLVVHIL